MKIKHFYLLLLNKSLSPSNTPNIILIRLTIPIVVAIVEIHIPSIARIGRIRSGRPIIVRGNIKLSISFATIREISQ